MEKIVKRKKLNKKKVVGFLCVIIVLVVGVSVLFTKKIFLTPPVNHIVSSKTIIDGKKGKVYVDYPITENEDVNDLIQNFIDDKLDGFYQDALDAKDTNDEINIGYEFNNFQSSIMTLKFVTYTYFDNQAHGETRIDTFTFNMDNGNVLELTDIFESESDLASFKDLLAHKIIDKVNNSEGEAYLSKEQVYEVVKNVSTYSLTPDGIDVYFQTYEVAPGSEGVQKFHFDKESLKGYTIRNIQDKQIAAGTPSKTVIKRRQELKEIAYYKGKKLVALTFDDGPHPKYTHEILETLKKYDVTATFFTLGQQVSKYPDIVKEIYECGHSVANHTYNHKDLKKLDANKRFEEIESTRKAIEKVGVPMSPYVRPPYGSFDKESIKMSDYAYILWNVDSEDWKLKDPDKVANNVIMTTKDGSIILMHDIQKVTTEALPVIIEKLKSEGYTFVDLNTYFKVRGKFEAGKSFYYMDKDQQS